MPEVNESMPTRGENVLNGRVIIDQIDGSIIIYDENDKVVNRFGLLDVVSALQHVGQATYDDEGNIIHKVGFLGNDGFGNPLYAAAAYDEDGNLVTGTGLIGSSDVSTRIYGTIVYDSLNRRVIMLRSSDRMLEMTGYSTTDTTKMRLKYSGSDATADIYPSNTLANIILNIKGNASGADSAYMAVSGFVETTFANSVYPASDNAYQLGQAGRRWSLIRGQTITSGDLAFEETRCHITGEEFLPDDEICLIMTRYDKEGDFIRTVPVLKHRGFLSLLIRKIKRKLVRDKS